MLITIDFKNVDPVAVGRILRMTRLQLDNSREMFFDVFSWRFKPVELLGKKN